MLLVGVNFDLRVGIEGAGFENWVGLIVTYFAYMAAMAGLFYACWVLWVHSVLSPVVRETAKVTSMVFAILIGSQLLNLVIISFGGEEYIQDFLRSFDEQLVVFLYLCHGLFQNLCLLLLIELEYRYCRLVELCAHQHYRLQTQILHPDQSAQLFYNSP